MITVELHVQNPERQEAIDQSLTAYCEQKGYQPGDLDIHTFTRNGHSTRIEEEQGDDVITRMAASCEQMASALESEGLSARFQLVVSHGRYFFLEIARLRAYRVIWAEMLQALQIQKTPALFIESRFASNALMTTPTRT